MIYLSMIQYVTSMKVIYMTLYLATFFILLGVDALWLSFVAMKLFTKYVLHLMGTFSLAPAGIFYFFYALGILLLVVLPYKDDPKKVFLFGALLGALCYGTYDLTNLATLKNWPLSFAIVDISWGTFVTAVTAFISSLIAKRLGL